MRTVLLVLQSEEFRLVLQDALKCQYHVLSAKDAIEGSVLLQHRPDALLIDLFLSGSDGLTFLEKNRAQLPPAILLFTTLADPVILKAASDLGVDAIFLKPCSLASVRRWLDGQK